MCKLCSTISECMVLPGALISSRTCTVPHQVHFSRSLAASAHAGTADPPTSAVLTLDLPTAHTHSNGHTSAHPYISSPTPAQPCPPSPGKARKSRQQTSEQLELSGDKSLDKISGIGPVTVKKLRDKGHDSIQSLAEFYATEYQFNQLRLVDYLKVGFSELWLCSLAALAVHI